MIMPCYNMGTVAYWQAWSFAKNNARTFWRPRLLPKHVGKPSNFPNAWVLWFWYASTTVDDVMVHRKNAKSSTSGAALAGVTDIKVGIPAHTLWMFQTLIHSYIFSGMVHLGNWNRLLFCFEKKSHLHPKTSRQKTRKKEASVFTSVFRNRPCLADVWLL